MMTTNLGDTTKVTMPANAAMAINEPVYGSCWLKAMENEMDMKHRMNDHFEARLTIPLRNAWS